MERLNNLGYAAPQEIINSLGLFDFEGLQILGIEGAKNHVFSTLAPYYAHLQGVLDGESPHGLFNDHTLPHHERVLEQTLKYLNQAGETRIDTAIKALLAVAFHDIGGIFGRKNHPQHSSRIAEEKIINVSPKDLSEITRAIEVDGLNPDELTANAPFPPVAAALNLADDLDLGIQRIPRKEDQEQGYLEKDAHARLNYATKKVEILGDKNYPAIVFWLNNNQKLVSDLKIYSNLLIQLNMPKLLLVTHSWFSLFQKSTWLTIITTNGREYSPILVRYNSANGSREINLKIYPNERE